MTHLEELMFYLDTLKVATDNKRDMAEFKKRLTTILLEGQMTEATFQIILKVIDLDNPKPEPKPQTIGKPPAIPTPRPPFKPAEPTKKVETRVVEPTTIDPCGIGGRSVSRPSC